MTATPYEKAFDVIYLVRCKRRHGTTSDDNQPVVVSMPSLYKARTGFAEQGAPNKNTNG
ncbi:MAG: hypothetical protein JWQ11_3752 [Rhizobacter sp.]|nr:hypothetical protein [Rhizobacter sp.]